MTNKVLLERLKEMNIAVKSHMSVIDEESVAGIKEAIFHGKSETVTEKRIKGSVIRRRKKIIEKKPEVEGITPMAKAEGEVQFELKVEFHDSERAERVAKRKGIVRIDGRTVSCRGDDVLELYAALIY